MASDGERNFELIYKCYTLRVTRYIFVSGQVNELLLQYLLTCQPVNPLTRQPNKIDIMQITINRIAKKATYTIGRLLIDGKYFCDTLEPADHGLKKKMSLVKIKKIKHDRGRTAIPTGNYRVLITKSPKFKEWLPLIFGVPGFEGIRIHAGNKPVNTRGCILVGRNRIKGQLVTSRAVLLSLIRAMTEALDREEIIMLNIR